MKRRFHPGATKDLSKSADWYAVRSEQAAQRFATAVDRALDAIEAAPRRFAFVGKHERACRVEKFPFQIVYRIIGDVVFIVAVAHVKRRPGYWKRRK